MRTLYRAARVHTLTYPSSGEWILIDGRHVERVGSGDPPRADRVIDLPGTTIIPGLIDTHVHLTSTGLALANEDVRAASSPRQLLDLARARSAHGAGPVLLQGFDETAWDVPAHPTLDALDAVTARPLVIRRIDGHLALANSAALDAAGLEAERGLERGPDGKPTGRVTQEAMQRLGRWSSQALDDRSVQDLQLQAAAVASARGVTTVHEMSMPLEVGLRDLQVLLGHRDRLPLDVLPIVATTDLAQVIDLGLPAIGGDLPLDGSIGARTAAVSVPYADGRGSGGCYYDDDELAELLRAAHAAGLQAGVHAIGDRAIAQVLSAWERVYHALDSRERRHFRSRRHRIEHFEMAGSEEVERAAMLGLAVSVQPSFDRRWGQPGGLYEARLGCERAMAMNPFRTMFDRGLEVGAGSDSPVTPLDPMLSITACEMHHAAAQRLSRLEAIRLHTVGGARIGHHEEKKGCLAPGMHADLAAYEDDPMTAESVEGLRPVLTVSLGRDVFAR